MGVIQVLGAKGDETLAWDPADEESVANAKAEWDRLKKDGYEFFTVEETKGKRLERFDRKLAKVIAAPGARKPSERGTGKRERAMAGGPTTR